MRSFRYVLLPKAYCDVRCLYCHQEGIRGARSVGATAPLSAGTLRDYIDALWPLGFRSLSFSGGEPMLAWPHVMEMIDAMPGDLDLSLITNGLQLGRVAQWRQQTSRELTIHLNLPSVDEAVYAQVMQTRPDRLRDVLHDVALAVDAGVIVDVNLVLYAGYNTDSRLLHDVQKSCQALGVRRLRFIEDAQPTQPAAGLDHFALPGWGDEATAWHQARLERVFHAGVVESTQVEFVRCDSALLRVPVDADVYFWSPGIARLGLTGRERGVANATDLLAVVEAGP